MNTTQDTVSTVHPFEACGLGKAPFRFVGMVQQDICYGEAILNRAEFQRTGVALTTKPGGTCAFCGNYIVRMFQIESADGRRFHVGCDCVEKTGDQKLARSVHREELRVERDKRAAKATAQKAELAALLTDEGVRAKLSPETLRRADWMLERAGAAGRARTLKAVRLELQG